VTFKLKNKYINIFIVSLFLVIPIILYYDIFFSSKYLAPGDGLKSYLPLKTLYYRILKNGELPLWNKFLNNGTSSVGDIQNATFYIFNLLFLPLPSVFSFNYFFLFHLSLAGIFTYMYVNSIIKDKYISFLGGLIFMLSPVLNVRKGHITIYSSIIWFPLILYFTEKFLKTNKRKYLVFCALGMGIQFFAGFPQIAVYSDLFIAFYFIVRAGSEHMGLKKVLKNGLTIISLYIGFISIQLFPLIEITRRSGRENVTFEFFKSYSNPVKSIIMLFFPWIYGNQNGHGLSNILMGYTQTEMALYIGIIPILCAIYSFFIKDKKNIYTLIFKIFFVVSILYSMLGEISIIAKIIYKMPILNSFRVPSRINFIFTFSCMMLCCLSLEYIFKKIERDEKNFKYLKFNKCFLFIMLIIAFTFNASIELFYTDGNIEKFYSLKSLTYLITFIIVLINIIVFRWYQKKNINKNIFIFILILVITADLYRVSIPYDKVVSRGSKESILEDTEVENYKIWNVILNSKEFEDDTSGLGPDVNILNNKMAINGYVTFWDKDYEKLTDFYSTGVSKSRKLIIENSILSMLSVKYVIENKNENTLLDKKFDKKNLSEIYEKKELILEKTKENLTLIEIPIPIEAEILYKVEFIAESPEGEELVLDLYGGDLYDSMEQELNFSISEKRKKYSEYIYSGSEVPENVIFLRFIKYGENQIKISDFKFYKVEKSEDTPYELYKETENYKIYTNKNAKPILYKPEKVVKEKISYDSLDYDFYKNVYIENIDSMNLENVKTNVTNVNFKYNSISADIKTSDNSFIVFSQSFYPGWKGYVDGKKVKIYKVNGVLQGIIVPKGDHKILLKYFPDSVIYGSIISFITLFIAIYFVVKKERDKNEF
jgi:hypothetical protein